LIKKQTGREREREKKKRKKMRVRKECFFYRRITSERKEKI
jgi:hypothetical protein